MRLYQLILGIAAMTVSIFSLNAQTAYTVSNFEMTVEGTSTLHDWTSEVTEVKAEAKLRIAEQRLQGIDKLVVTVPAESIKSTKGRIMDNKTYDALKSKRNPNITFKMADAKVTPTGANTVRVEASGQLTIAGATRTVTLKANGTAAKDGNITFVGSKSLLMTDYNMETPTALMGTITTGDEVTICFKLTLETDSQQASR